MASVRQLLIWLVVAAVSTAVLLKVLSWERGRASIRWSALPIGSARAGSALFQKKGCAHCHSVNGAGGTSGPDLGSGHSSLPRPDHLVVALWNHAPRMFERIRAEHLDYPRLDDQEMADVFAYLFVARCGDDVGDPAQGRRLYEAKGCMRCHEAGGPWKEEGSSRQGVSPVEWARAMWNHPAPGEAGGPQPTFEAREMSDLLAFAQGTGTTGPDALLLNADPDRGWMLFREKSCVSCHSVKDETGRVGPQLGPGHELPPTVAELASTMWNHSEGMSRAMREQGLTRPRLASREMADLVAFLYSVHSAEPGGSPLLGEVLYTGRGCARCHGPRAEGTEEGPGLRGRGRRFTSVSFAAALWRHGPRVYEKARAAGQRWPALSEGDVGDLITFLNSSATARP